MRCREVGPKSPYGRAGNHRTGLGRAVRPCSSPAIRSSAGAEPRVRPCRPARAPQADVEASSVGGGGPRHLVRRDDSPWLTGGSPSGTEVSSGPPDSRRSPGRGVEEARGSPRAGTPGNPGSPTFIHHLLLRSVASLLRSPNVGRTPPSRWSVVGPLTHYVRSRCDRLPTAQHRRSPRSRWSLALHPPGSQSTAAALVARTARENQSAVAATTARR